MPAIIRFLQSAKSLVYIPLYVSANQGFFQDAGLEIINFPSVDNADTSVQAVARGDVDITATGTLAVFPAVAARLPVRSFAVLAKQPAHEITLTNNAIEVLRAKGISANSPVSLRVGGLRGLRIADPGPGSGARSILRSTLFQYGVDPDKDVDVRAILPADSIVAAARSGKVDGYIFTSPTADVPVAEGWGSVWINYSKGEVPAHNNMHLAEFTANSRYLDANPEEVVLFVRAVWRGFRFLHDSPEAARAIVRENFPNIPEQLFEAAYDTNVRSFEGDLIPRHEGFDVAFSVWRSSLGSAPNIAFDEVYDTVLSEKACQM